MSLFSNLIVDILDFLSFNFFCKRKMIDWCKVPIYLGRKRMKLKAVVYWNFEKDCGVAIRLMSWWELVSFLNIPNGPLESPATLVWEATWLGACFGSVWKETWNWSWWHWLTVGKDEVFGISWEMVRLRQIFFLKITFVFYPLCAQVLHKEWSFPSNIKISLVNMVILSKKYLVKLRSFSGTDFVEVNIDPEKFWDIFVFMKAAAFCFRVELHKLARYHWEQCSDQVRNKMARTAAAAAWGLGMFILPLVCNLVGNDIITK